MLPDEALFEQLLAGDLSGFDALYARYSRHLFGFIAAQLEDRAEAEDVLHEVFLTVLHEARSARRARVFRSWLFQVAKNACLNRLRSRRRAAAALKLAPPAEPEVPAEAQLLAHQSAQALAKAVEALPGTLAELYHLRAQGLSYQELASVLGVPLGTIKSRLHEMVSRLKEALAS